MKKAIFIAMLLSILLLPTIVLAASSFDSLLTALATSKIAGRIGIMTEITEAKNDDEDNDEKDGNIGVGFLELGFLTDEFQGFKLGTQFIGVSEIWANESYEFEFDRGGIFEDEAMLKEAYLIYALPHTETEILVGRKQFKSSSIMNGDAHQGIQVTINDFDRFTIYASVINSWIENATVTMDGISNTWLDGDDIVADTSDTVYSLIGEIDLISDVLGLTPFITQQSKIVTTYGADLDISIPLTDKIMIGFEGIYTYYQEDTEDPLDANADSYLGYGFIGAANWQIGAGYYMMSDDPRVNLTAVGTGTFDPMEEAVYGAEQDDHTLYFDVKFKYEPFELEAVYGDTKINRTNKGTIELDLFLTYEITDAITCGLLFVDVKDETPFLDYQVYGGEMSLNF